MPHHWFSCIAMINTKMRCCWQLISDGCSVTAGLPSPFPSVHLISVHSSPRASMGSLPFYAALCPYLWATQLFPNPWASCNGSIPSRVPYLQAFMSTNLQDTMDAVVWITSLCSADDDSHWKLPCWVICKSYSYGLRSLPRSPWVCLQPSACPHSALAAGARQPWFLWRPLHHQIRVGFFLRIRHDEGLPGLSSQLLATCAHVLSRQHLLMAARVSSPRSLSFILNMRYMSVPGLIFSCRSCIAEMQAPVFSSWRSWPHLGICHRLTHQYLYSRFWHKIPGTKWTGRTSAPLSSALSVLLDGCQLHYIMWCLDGGQNNHEEELSVLSHSWPRFL